jgi:hypothetical protein
MKIEDVKQFCEIEGTCWIWTKGCDGRGKPQMRLDGRPQYARRVMRAQADGKPIAPRYVVTSTCNNLLCVSPHCSIKVSKQTSARMAGARGAFSHPAKIARMVATKASKSKYSAELIQIVRESQGSASSIATNAGMSLSHAKAIRTGASRRDNTNPFAQLMR